MILKCQNSLQNPSPAPLSYNLLLASETPVWLRKQRFLPGFVETLVYPNHFFITPFSSDRLRGLKGALSSNGVG
jgi:hypothetical protein